MGWQRTLNRALTRGVGLELRRVQPNGALGGGAITARPHRLVPSPVFVISSVRSGSTLLRVLLNGHSRLHAPHELHLLKLKVRQAESSLPSHGDKQAINVDELEHILWDRVLHRLLEQSGKDHIVDKTPGNALAWRRVASCWPEAKFIFLLRHPWTTAASWADTSSERALPDATATVLKFMNAVESARQNLPGHTVRYEDITAQPEEQMRHICEFLEVEWEPAMLEYGQSVESDFKRGLGDWRSKIKSGQVQEARAIPDGEIPPELRDLCAAWGYLDGGS